jgi:hypothetical protein
MRYVIGHYSPHSKVAHGSNLTLAYRPKAKFALDKRSQSEEALGLKFHSDERAGYLYETHRLALAHSRVGLARL